MWGGGGGGGGRCYEKNKFVGKICLVFVNEKGKISNGYKMILWVGEGEILILFTYLFVFTNYIKDLLLIYHENVIASGLKCGTFSTYKHST